MECPECGAELDTPENNDALADDDMFAYFCPRCGELYTENDSRLTQ